MEIEISKDMTVLEVLEKYPKLLDVFVKKGFTPLKDPVMRKTMAGSTTIEQACVRFGLDVQKFVEELKEAAK
ncbi:DUF1858 domain-containing protein [Candidatus Hecatella orcuttiae]|jgi:hypothetical protein|uniref:DUF1858 domain-containing protein n=1 Tax=Candidatus Hecatella orcuttiae TaxID=1935119 RepID=UPI002867BBCE|nr:DUF1858 domain-containing protein [Candidatus Hecatella orcuttiae]